MSHHQETSLGFFPGQARLSAQSQAESFSPFIRNPLPVHFYFDTVAIISKPRRGFSARTRRKSFLLGISETRSIPSRVQKSRDGPINLVIRPRPSIITQHATRECHWRKQSSRAANPGNICTLLHTLISPRTSRRS